MTLRPMGGAGFDAQSWARARHLAEWLEQLLGPGRLLDDAIRRRMEDFFGYSLEDVRIHDSRQAGEVARRLGAEAFAIGGQVFGDAESLNTLSPEGMGLVAHELAHVIQQTQPPPLPHSGVVASKPTPAREQSATSRTETAQLARYSPPSVSSAEEPGEAEARASEEVMRQVAESGEQAVEASPEVDIEELADRIYRLMRRELMLDRERSVRTT